MAKKSKLQQAKERVRQSGSGGGSKSAGRDNNGQFYLAGAFMLIAILFFFIQSSPSGPAARDGFSYSPLSAERADVAKRAAQPRRTSSENALSSKDRRGLPPTTKMSRNRGFDHLIDNVMPLRDGFVHYAKPSDELVGLTETVRKMTIALRLGATPPSIKSVNGQVLVEAALVDFNDKKYSSTATSLQFLFKHIDHRPKQFDLCFEVLMHAAEALSEKDIPSAIVFLRLPFTMQSKVQCPGELIQDMNKWVTAYNKLVPGYSDMRKWGDLFTRKGGMAVPGLTSQTYHNPKQHPVCKAFEENYDDIRDELSKYLTRDAPFEENDWTNRLGGKVGESGYTGAVDQSLTSRGEWKDLGLFKGPQKLKNCDMFPKTCKMIEGLPELTFNNFGPVEFSMLTPGTDVRAHTGESNMQLTYHLTIEMPRDASPKELGISCGGEERQWEIGKCLVFDDSYLHSVWHRYNEGKASTKNRYVLLARGWHPELTPAERSFVTEANPIDLSKEAVKKVAQYFDSEEARSRFAQTADQYSSGMFKSATKKVAEIYNCKQDERFCTQ